MSTAAIMQSSTQQEAPSSLPSMPPLPSSASAEDFKCNICLNTASDAVVTVCGHLFCWPCLYTWLHFHSRFKECPVCKGATSEARVIPIYSWGCKDTQNASKSHNTSSKNIPPRPPARRVESERQRRQRYQAERGRQMNQAASVDMHQTALNQILFGLNECGASTGALDPRTQTTSTSVNGSGNSNSASVNYHHMGRETRASWLERLRAMREERLVWPVAFVHGLTSRELLQQRRQAREHGLSPRLSMNLGQESPMVGTADINAAAWYCQSGQPLSGALQRTLSLANMDREPRHMSYNQPAMPAASSSTMANTSHTAQYLSTMSSILSSMEVFAKALELSSVNSLSQSSSSSSAFSPSATMLPQHAQTFNTPNEEHDLWKSSMRGLLAQMERLTMQLQSMQTIASLQSAAPNHHFVDQSHWMSAANAGVMPANVQPQHHHHHHHYHLDGSLSDRSTAHMVNPVPERGFPDQEGDIRCNAMNTSNVLGLSPRMHTQGDSKVNMASIASVSGGQHGSRSSAAAFTPSQLHNSHGGGRDLKQPNTSKSRKRWDVIRMST